VEIKAVAREAGYRSKVAVAARQPGIDPVGCCVGLRGIRIQNIVSELSGEKIDVVQWNPDLAAFIASALSPAQIIAVELDKSSGVATVIVPDRMLSLAIGREGQNARLAAKLTGWKIDIKMSSVWEAEKALRPPVEVAEEVKEAAVPEAVAEPVAVGAVAEGAPTEAAEEAPAEEAAAEVPQEEVPVVAFKPAAPAGSKGLRFAEDIAGAPRAGEAKGKGKKKKAAPEREGEAPRVRKGRRQEIAIEDEEEY
jgi:N utilization substance protein A